MLKIPARFKQCDLSVSLAFDYCDCIVNMGTRAAACKHQIFFTFPTMINVIVPSISIHMYSYNETYHKFSDGISVTVKIRSLYDYQLRLMQGIMPSPSGVDIANTIKYFSQTLLSKYL